MASRHPRVAWSFGKRASRRADPAVSFTAIATLPTSFAPTIASPLPEGDPLRLRYLLPHVWTQRAIPGARPFAVYWSYADGLGQLHPAPSDDELRRFYDTPSYDAYMGAGKSPETRPGTTRRSLSARLLARIARWFDHGVPLTPAHLHERMPRRPGRICDLGCGGGAMLRGMAALGHSVLGVDPNPVAVASGSESGLPVLRGTAEELPAECPRRAFDLVLLSHSLEHCRDPQRALRNATSLLAAGGVLAVEVPNHACAGFEVSGPAWFHTDAGRHLWFFTPRSLHALARAVGLERVTFEFDGFARQFAWLAAEQEVWDALYAGSTGGSPPPRPSWRSQWRLLLRSLRGRPEHRYDSMRMFAHLP